MGRDARHLRLEAAYAATQERALSFEPVTDDDQMAVMDIALTEADLAGIADAILTNLTFPEIYKEMLKHNVLKGSRLQLRLLKADAEAPSEFDLSQLPDFLAYAQDVEELRMACFEIVFGTRH
jgi:hypothetical protein